MTVKELIEVSPSCDTVEIVVREHGHGQWVQGYLIGKDIDYYPAFVRADRRESYEETRKRRLKDGEEVDGQHSYKLPMKLIKKSVEHIPEHIAKLEVCSVQPRHIPTYHREQATHNEYMYDINCYPEGFVPEKEQPSAEQKAAVMQGQMSLEELGIV